MFRNLGRALAVGATVLTIGVGVSAIPSAAATTTPTVAVTLPASIGVGGAPAAASAQVANPTTTSYDAVRVDFALSGVAGLQAQQVHLTYADANGAQQPIPLTQSDTATITGAFGPQTGFPLPAGYDRTTPLKVSVDAAAPTGTLHVVTTLDTVDSAGAVTGTLGTDSDDVTLAKPSLTFAPPATLVTGAAPSAFSGSVANSTGSDYAALRVDLSLAVPTGLTAGQLTLEYDAGSAGWQQIPLTQADTDTVTGTFGPAAGFPAANAYASTTTFRIAVASGAPTGTVTTTARLVDVSGSTPVTLAQQTATTQVTAPAPPPAPQPVSVVAYTGVHGVPFAKRSDSTQWVSLGGALADAPAVASTGNGHVVFVGRGTTNRLYVRTDRTGWTPFASATARCYQPSVAVDGTTLVVACRGGNNHLWAGYATLGTGNPVVTRWRDLGGTIVAADVHFEDGTPVFAVTGAAYGADGENTYVYDPTSGWDRLELPCATHPTMGYVNDVGYIACNASVDGLVYVRVDVKDDGSDPIIDTAGGRVVGAPALAVRGDGSSATVYLQGTDNVVRALTLDATGAHDWQRLGGNVARPGVGAAQLVG